MDVIYFLMKQWKYSRDMPPPFPYTDSQEKYCHTPFRFSFTYLHTSKAFCCLISSCLCLIHTLLPSSFMNLRGKTFCRFMLHSCHVFSPSCSSPTLSLCYERSEIRPSLKYCTHLQPSSLSDSSAPAHPYPVHHLLAPSVALRKALTLPLYLNAVGVKLACEMRS